MSEPDVLQRITVSVDIDYEPDYQHIAAGVLLEVIGKLAHDGIEPRAVSLQISGPITTP